MQGDLEYTDLECRAQNNDLSRGLNPWLTVDLYWQV